MEFPVTLIVRLAGQLIQEKLSYSPVSHSITVLKYQLPYFSILIFFCSLKGFRDYQNFVLSNNWFLSLCTDKATHI